MYYSIKNKNCHKFISLFLERGFVLKNFLTHRKLLKLYNDVNHLIYSKFIHISILTILNFSKRYLNRHHYFNCSSNRWVFSKALKWKMPLQKAKRKNVSFLHLNILVKSYKICLTIFTSIILIKIPSAPYQ